MHLLGFRQRPPLQVGLVCILLNGLTLPLATWFYFSLNLNYWAMEGGVVVLEALVLALVWENKTLRGRLAKAFWVSLAANAASIALGEVLFGG